MSVLGMFQPAVLGMTVQAHALSVISTNVSNVNTGGYKSTDTQFATLVSGHLDGDKDFGGVRPNDFNNIADQGLLLSSDRVMDAAINGTGFFVVNTQLDGGGETLFTRDGSFDLKVGDDFQVTTAGGQVLTVQEGYLVDKNGFYIQGWPADDTGAINISSSTSPIRIDPYAFTETGEPTTAATFYANLPADLVAGDAVDYNAALYDSNGALKSARLDFTKDPAAGSWTLSVATNDPGDVIASLPATVQFDANGGLVGPTSYAIDVTWADGATSAVTVDITETTQFAGNFVLGNYFHNGLPASDMTSFEFDTLGRLIGQFGNSVQRPLYQLALGTFPNPNGLVERSGNVYVAGPESGTLTLTTAALDGFATIAPNTVELSNVELANEFSRMIMAQNAYNASATSFRTVDEMLQEASRLKR